MNNQVQEALRQATLYTDDLRYRILHLPANAITVAAAIVAEIGEPFAALLVDKDEVTLVLSEDDYPEYERRLLGRRSSDSLYRLITIDLIFDLNFVGFLAYVSAALAQAGIPVMAYSSFQRDHLLVAENHFDQAMQVLQTLQQRD
ncbi:MAG: ACT domain-containing protein [Anaerolineae bacterium]|nr:ACT domain-containing protein [Anaerolineae bacterium]